MDGFEMVRIGGWPRLRASQLRDLTGLSDRQFHEWDKRGAFPHDRRKGGQRRVSAWDAMALTIVAAIRERYHLPLTRLRPLLQWMIGKKPLFLDEALTFTAAYKLTSQTQAEADFKRDLYRFSQQPPRGVSFLKEVPDLLTRADTLGNPEARSAVHCLAGGFVPLYRALGEMTTGFPVFLVTDLQPIPS